ncbi:MAG: hypothetical protein OEQ39_14605 [Gammaproteobacteria bacterium]|nr:hypothetical protein [Gammaproteobacteria bacterium]MDH3468730.1 hypothetical protein [Gammaproteobacteria bacterium]
MIDSVQLLGGTAEKSLLAGATVTSITAIWLHKKRHILTLVSSVLLLFACISLSAHLLLDHFGYRYVWLYSAPQLPAYLKISNLWGGEEGTLLVLATILSLIAIGAVRYPGWTGPGVLFLTAGFACAALIWNPFTTTSADQLALYPSRGMNVHLTTIWIS